MAMRMNDERLAWDLQHAPSIRLLKAENAALIIGFLYQQFKGAQRVSIPLSELVEKLEAYLEQLNEQTQKQYAGSAQKYLREWADDGHRYIRIAVYGQSNVPAVELTAETERALGWLEDMHPIVANLFYFSLKSNKDQDQRSSGSLTGRLRLI